MAHHPKSHIIALFVQALLYGLYVATLAHCFRWLMFADEGWKLQQKISRLRWYLTIPTILIFIFATMNLGLQLWVTIGKLGTADIDTVAKPIIEDSTKFATLLISDAILLFRCWKIYEGSQRVIFFPALFWVVCLISSIIAVYYDCLPKLRPEMSQEAEFHGVRALSSFYAFNIATNVYATSAIVYRILRVANANGSRSRVLYGIAHILAESGILYTAMTIFSLIGGVFDVAVVSDLADTINFSTACITFNLVLMGRRLGRTSSEDDCADSQTMNGRKSLSRLRVHVPHSPASSQSSIQTPYDRTYVMRKIPSTKV